MKSDSNLLVMKKNNRDKITGLEFRLKNQKRNPELLRIGIFLIFMHNCHPRPMENPSHQYFMSTF